MTTQGTEARRGETAGLDAKRDGPVAAGDAPQTTDNRENIVTTSEQQAVPVAQEDEARKVLAAEMLDNHAASTFLAGKDRLISTRAALRAMHRFASLPCKSGEGAGERGLSVAMREINEMAVGVGDIFPNDATAIVAIGQTASAALDMFDARIVGDAKAYVEAMAIVATDPVAALAALTPDATQTREAEGEWRKVEQETMRKGLRRSPKYYPAIGETCRMSGPNCDDADGFTWAEVEVLWRDDLFIVTRVPGCWPTVTKLELALFEPRAALNARGGA